MWVRQCDLDARAEAPQPIPARIASNEEFIPPPQSPQQIEYEARLDQRPLVLAAEDVVQRDLVRVHAAAGQGDLAFQIALHEGRQPGELKDRCRLLSATVKKAYDRVRVLILASVLVVPVFQGYLLFSGPFLAAALMSPVWGFLGDKYGHKMIVVRAIAARLSAGEAQKPYSVK